MTVADQSSYVSYIGNGVTTVFPFSFRVLLAQDVAVYIETIATRVLEQVDADEYTVALGEDSGGTVTYLPALPSTKRIYLFRDSSAIQPLMLENQARFYAEDVMRELDRSVLLNQELRREQARAISLARGQQGFNNQLQGQFLSGRVITTTDDGLGLVLKDIVDLVNDVQSGRQTDFGLITQPVTELIDLGTLATD